MGKGKLWLLAEDKALAEAWVEVAERASASPDETFWSLVHANWVARPGSSQRSEQALKNHWRYLQDAVRTFGKYVREALAESSGDASSAESNASAAAADAEPAAVSDDVTERALRLYLDSERESFTLVPVWSVLHKSAKWHSSKTPGSSLKRSRATNGYVFKSEKLNKRLSLPAGVGNGHALARETAAPAPAAVAEASKAPAPSRDPKPDAASTAHARTADRRLSLPTPAAAAHTDTALAEPAVAAEPRPLLRTSASRAASSSSSTSASATDATRVRHSTYSTAAEQLASALRDANDSAAHEMLQTLLVANDPVRASVAPERDSYAASIAELAAAQVEKNALVADQMLMTMLLADPSDAANQRALAQLKQKYLQRAFSSAKAASASGGSAADA